MNEGNLHYVHTEVTSSPTPVQSWLHTKRAANMEAIRRLTRRVRANDAVGRIVVVVDEEPIVALTLAEILEKHGMRAVWFTNPQEALSFMQGVAVDLLLSDINMPEMDGISLCEVAHVLQPACFLFLFSAAADEFSVLERMQASELPAYFEVKPLHPLRLVQKVKAMLSLEGDSVA